MTNFMTDKELDEYDENAEGSDWVELSQEDWKRLRAEIAKLRRVAKAAKALYHDMDWCHDLGVALAALDSTLTSK